jgi:hypothetical protein
MKTLESIGFLIILAVIANFATVIVLNFAGLPGALLAGRPGKGSERFIFGTIVAAIGQSYVYLAYTAFVVNWTMSAISKQGMSFILYPVAFLAVALPLWSNLITAIAQAKEEQLVYAQTYALCITSLLVPIGFFIFALKPEIMGIIYIWVPGMKP